MTDSRTVFPSAGSSVPRWQDRASEAATVREPALAVVQGTSGRFASAGRLLPSFPRRRESTTAEAAGELPYKPERSLDAGATIEGYGRRLGDAARWVVDGCDRTSEAVCGAMPAVHFPEMADGQR